MEKVYIFKVALKYRKGLWRRIEIQGDQTLNVQKRKGEKCFYAKIV